MADKIVKLIKEKKVAPYRSVPFWSWNDKLEPAELVSQIKWMKEQGFGGYFMHARGGLKTEYLGDDWFECVNACLDAGKKYKMNSWAYDENGWPSGFAGGKLLEDPENHDRYLTYKTGAFDKDALVSYDLSKDKLIRVQNGVKGVEYLNVYEHLSVSTADILNGEVMDKFISLTHEEYKKRCGKKFKKLLKGFFTDEPQYYRWAHPYTKVLKTYFKEVYNEDILDGLGLMFVEKQGYRAFRYKYWTAMQTLMLENFGKKIYDWCNENGVSLTGHYIEEGDLEWQIMNCGGIMPFYLYENIPGMDKLCRFVDADIMPKQVSSVARQSGKKQALTETYAMCGWDVTPLELKRLGDWQYVHGINLMCEHLMPYSEEGQRKRDYPAHFSWVNPWVRKDMKTFNDYFARLGYLTAESEEHVSVAIFCPVRSLYFDYKREKVGALRGTLTQPYIDLCQQLSAMNVNYHIIDETVMERLNAKATGKKLTVGQCSYDYVIFPNTITLGKYSAQLFENYYKFGGKMLFNGEMPTYIEGEEHKYSFKSNCTLDDIVKSQPYFVDKKDTSINSAYYTFKGKDFIYAANIGDKTYTVTYGGNFKSFIKVDLEKLTEEKVPATVTLEAGESAILFFSDDIVEEKPAAEEFTLSGEFENIRDSGNYLTLDKVEYSTDGEKYSKPLSYMGVFNEMLDRRYDGDLYLKYKFTVKDLPQHISFLTEDMNNIWCKVNGKEVIFDGVSDFEKKIRKADITSCVVEGENEAILKIHFFEKEDVYFALFGENVTESLKNCLAYDTTIEPCYLFGEFGVYSEKGLKAGKEKNVLLGDDFYIGKKQKIVTETVESGYPFFAGSITLGKEFNYDGGATVLRLNGRYHLAEIKVNGKKVAKGYFDSKVELKDYLVKGKNVAEITLYSSNRNLMGPHHMKDAEEPIAVAPDSFELLNTWKNGKSDKERDNYSFVKFGLFD